MCIYIYTNKDSTDGAPAQAHSIGKLPVKKSTQGGKGPGF